MLPLIGAQTPPLAVGEHLGDLELAGSAVSARSHRRAAEGAVRELELADARHTVAVRDGVLAAHDEPFAAALVGRLGALARAGGGGAARGDC
jgi:hypothetical protein